MVPELTEEPYAVKSHLYVSEHEVMMQQHVNLSFLPMFREVCIRILIYTCLMIYLVGLSRFIMDPAKTKHYGAQNEETNTIIMPCPVPRFHFLSGQLICNKVQIHFFDHPWHASIYLSCL